MTRRGVLFSCRELKISDFNPINVNWHIIILPSPINKILYLNTQLLEKI